LTCSIDGKRTTPLQIDRDLLSVANLWFPQQLIQPTAKVVRSFDAQPQENQERILFVGTSFLWSLFHHLDKAPFFRERDMYYYFKRSFPFPHGKITPIKREQPRWIARALKSKYIVLEVNEGFIHRLGYGFPKRMLREESTSN
ncbi:MAG: hypothetical protein KDD55_06475, partial [Bdellovibrionales bacterium]|nr:hypothetical protein [Bdellovibrionales bacterium]